MSCSTLRRALAAASLFHVALASTLPEAAAAVDTLALTGKSAPGGGQYFDFSLVKINDAGQVAFQSIVNNNFIDHAVFRSDADGSVTQIARRGQSVGDGTLSELTYADLNNVGQIVFRANLAGTSAGVANDEAIYLGSGGSLQQVVREGAAFNHGGFSSPYFGYKLKQLGDLSFSEGPVLNDLGQVAFTGRYTAEQPIINGSTTVTRDAAMRANADGSVNMAFEIGAAAPVAGGGTSGTLGEFVGPALQYNPTGLINKQGNVMFRTLMTGTSDEGFFWSNLSSMPTKLRQRAVVRDGQTNIPGAPGTIDIQPGTPPFYMRTSVAMNDSGEVAFLANLHPAGGGATPDYAVYRWSPVAAAVAGANGLTEIARQGTPSPDGDGLVDYLFFANLGFNNKGQAVFQSWIKNSSFGPDDRGIFRGDGQHLDVIARLADKTPDGQHYFGLVGATVMANDTAINDAGQVAFMVPLRDANGDFFGHGIYLSDGIDTVEVARVGRSLAGSTIDSLNWFGLKGLNKYGQVAFNADLANGHDGVFRFTPDDIRWRNPGSGNWDDNKNWTLSTIVGDVHKVTIAPTGAATITGPAKETIVKSVTIGDAGGQGSPTLDLKPNTFVFAVDSLTLHANSHVKFEIGSGFEFGQLLTAGHASLDGILEASLVNGFIPQAGEVFNLLGWGSTDGAFRSLVLPVLSEGLAWGTSRLYMDGTLRVTWSADFDEDGDVDAADLAQWKLGLGTLASAKHSQGDADGNGAVDGNDFLAWQRQLGSQTLELTGLQVSAVPEPATASLAAAILGLLVARSRERSPLSR